MAREHKKDQDLAYYITLIKIKGHSTWRAMLHGSKAGFKREWESGQRPEITAEKAYRIDRITGTITPEI